MKSKQLIIFLSHLIWVTIQQEGGGDFDGGDVGDSFEEGERSGLDWLLVGCVVVIALYRLWKEYQRKRRNKQFIIQYKNIQESKASGKVSPEKFEQMAFDFDEMWRGVTCQMKRFIYIQRNDEINVQILGVSSQIKKPYISEMTVKGKDKFGTWEGKGAFMLTELGPFFWMLKYYDDALRAKQTGQWQNLIYESTECGQGCCNGRWFFQNMEDNAQYSGTWRLS